MRGAISDNIRDQFVNAYCAASTCSLEGRKIVTHGPVDVYNRSKCAYCGRWGHKWTTCRGCGAEVE